MRFYRNISLVAIAVLLSAAVYPFVACENADDGGPTDTDSAAAEESAAGFDAADGPTVASWAEQALDYIRAEEYRIRPDGDGGFSIVNRAQEPARRVGGRDARA
ncbi:MAG: hypothetical protein M5R36_08725 [Deltaproteobacteria bacterium]|nr:hypothetical protein [Deltaproteobacteria bacterium]